MNRLIFRRIISSLLPPQNLSSKANARIVQRRFCNFNARPRSSSRSTSVQIQEIENALRWLENDQKNNGSPVSSYIFTRLPYFCEINGLEKKFISVVDRWWNRFMEISEDGKLLMKPTSTVFHLGYLNKNHNGLIMKKLGPSAIASLLEISSKFDFRKLPEQDDLLSYLSGVRDLVLKPGCEKILYPSLRPTNVDFFLNLERYFRQKLELKTSGEKSSRENWLFTIMHESLQTLAFFRIMEIPRTVVRRGGDDLLRVLCRLAKEGFDDLLLHSDQTKIDELSNVKFLLWNYAVLWINWRLDPDYFVADSWSSWFEIYDQKFIELPASQASMIIYHHLDYISYLPQIALLFGKMELFQCRFEKWINDFAKSFRLFCQRKSDGTLSQQDLAKGLANAIFSYGELFNSRFIDQSVIDLLNRSFPPIVNDFFGAVDPSWMDDLSLKRFLTAWRNFQLLRKAYDRDWNEFGDKLLSFLNAYFDKRLETVRDKDRPDDDLATDVTTIMVLLARMKFRVNTRLWTNFITLFHIGFVGKSEQLFLADQRQFLRTLLAFGESSCVYASLGSEFNANDDQIWKEYFASAKRILEKFEPDFGSQKVSNRNWHDAELDEVDPDSLSTKQLRLHFAHYGYFVSILLRLAAELGLTKQFVSIRMIWQHRVSQLMPSFAPRRSYLDAKRMRYLMERHNIQFDQKLLETMDLQAGEKPRRTGKRNNVFSRDYKR